MVKNYMEDLVENSLNEILSSYPNICKCDECKDDIRAITLNKFKPIYFVEAKGNVYSKLDSLESQFKTDIVTELIKSIEVVYSNPEHRKKIELYIKNTI